MALHLIELITILKPGCCCFMLHSAKVTWLTFTTVMLHFIIVPCMNTTFTTVCVMTYPLRQRLYKKAHISAKLKVKSVDMAASH